MGKRGMSKYSGKREDVRLKLPSTVETSYKFKVPSTRSPQTDAKKEVFFLSSENIPEHNPVTNNLSKYDWYTCIRASIDHKKTPDTSFRSPRHIKYILKLY